MANYEDSKKINNDNTNLPQNEKISFQMGVLADGKLAIVRSDSASNKPVLEVYDGKEIIKIRYGK